MRGDKSFAYDLIVRYGPVSSRVALLLRSAEGKPPSTRFVLLKLSIYRPALPGPRRSRSRDGVGRPACCVLGSTEGLVRQGPLYSSNGGSQGGPQDGASFHVYVTRLQGNLAVQLADARQPRGGHPGPSGLRSTSTSPGCRVTLPCGWPMPVEPKGDAPGGPG
jgi:hypothetical protein